MRPGLIMVCDVDLTIPDATRTHTVEVARGFAQEGLDVDLVTQGPDPEVDGVRHHRVRVPLRPRWRRLLALNTIAISLLWRRRRVARRLYVRNRWSVVLIMLVARLLRYSVVMQVDDMAYGPGYERAISPVEDYSKRITTYLTCRFAHGFVAVTPQLKELLVAHFAVDPDRVRVLPNGVDVDFIHPLAREPAIERLGLDAGLRYVVFCGNLADWVDFETLLGGFSSVARAEPRARLLLVGDGDERERVEQRADELGLDGRVIFTGFVADRARVRDYLGASTLAVASHASDYINRIGVSPTKVAEYLAAGRAVVAKAVPGLSEVLESSDGGVAVRGGAGEMGQAMLTLLDPARADELGRNGRRFAESRLTWPSIVHRTMPLFELARARSQSSR
ncbi:MAG: glycosyltransferase family 4 protein [Solirubrobacterales bacterium]|nr:glycosyltransferase family 4 protein [Solirubrobacterales bacterium]